MALRRTIVIEDANIFWKNFAGREAQYNEEGDRNFCLEIPGDMEVDLRADGWPLKTRLSQDPEEPPLVYLPVKVSYKNIPPNVVMVTSTRKQQMTEENVGLLDGADIIRVDLEVTPYNWSYRDRSGIKAYLKEMFVTIAESRFADRYRDIPDGN
jgi:hypothetical protein